MGARRAKGMMTDFVYDIWYFGALISDIPRRGRSAGLHRIVIAGEPICLGRRDDGSVFAMRDICPHRAAPFSAGCLKGGGVECPYHGWVFDTQDGHCTDIPALTPDSRVEPEKIRVRTYPVSQTGNILWIWISADKRFSGEPPFPPPAFPLVDTKPVIDDGVTLNCHVDHAVIGLMDPAHGPFVHQQWWWRSEASMHEKAKAFEPRDRGFAMAAHSPSSNSAAYKLLGGKPVTEITFQLPGIRTEHITVGEKIVLSFTAVTPEDEDHTRIRQLFFTDHGLFKVLSPVLGFGARAFLRQDADMVDLQAKGLRFDPNLMLIEDADTQAKWYHQLKKAWAHAQDSGDAFVNPVKARTLRWRS
ncbi:MAG: aromatic ring-hydroxylating dioxygenase subunit alpha [Pseudomonadota bacterium]